MHPALRSVARGIRAAMRYASRLPRSIARLSIAAGVAVLLTACAAQSEPRILHDAASRYGPVIVTQEADGVRVLRFAHGGARQSVVKPDDPTYVALSYARTALVGLALVDEPRRILVVGLGGGTLPRFVHHYYPAATVDAVDINPEVVRVAKDYFGFREDSRLRAHVADGRRYIEQARVPYDLIFLDAYGANDVPAHLTTQEFLRAVRRALTPGGVVVGNLWGDDFNGRYAAMVRTYQSVFDTVKILPAEYNRIVLALPRSADVTTKGLAARAAALSRSREFPFDLGAMVTDPPPGEDEAVRRGQLLRDRGKTDLQAVPGS